LFIDAVVLDTHYGTGWSAYEDGYESDEELRRFIDANYELAYQLPLVENHKQVRFFVRRAAAAPPS
jgi:hypothetical protein